MLKMLSIRAAFMAILFTAATASTSASAAPQDAAAMRWRLLDAEGGKSRAQFDISPNMPLPDQGWAIYFNVQDSLVTGPLDGHVVLEEVSGGLFRLRPAPGFTWPAAGHALTVIYRYPTRIFKMLRVPEGPYLVLEQSHTAYQIRPYDVTPLPASALPEGSSKHARVTPQDIYRHNAEADLLPPSALPPILPTPLQTIRGEGRLALQRAPQIVAGPELAQEAKLAAGFFSGDGQASAAAPQLPLRLSVGPVAGQASPEAYTLSVDAGGIAIVGNSAAGVSRGLWSLRDLIALQRRYPLALPVLNVVDAPRFGYRGFQLDVARNFASYDEVARVLRQMAMYKLNTLHFHLTDDEGWRLEIPGLPELTDVGARRGYSAQPDRMLPPAYGSGPDPANRYGSGYYTRAGYIKLLRLAAELHIDVIPEIEMPGHTRAAVKAMEARYHRTGSDQYLLQDPDDRSVYRSPQDYTDHVINPARESTYAFIEHVVGEVAAMHREAGVPLRTIHVGGDELPGGAWERSPMVQALMQRERLSSMADVWDYFYDRVDGILRKQGLSVSGWEELGARREGSGHVPNPYFLGRGFSLYVWNNTEGAEDFAYRLANAGYDTVLAPVTRMYLDMAVNANPEEVGANWGAYVDLQTIYDFVPLDYLRGMPGKAALSASGREHIRGLEATLFTETVHEPGRLEYMLQPRLAAVGERAWAADPAWAHEADPAKAAALHRAAWSGFINALGQRVAPRLGEEGVHYRIAPPGLAIRDGQVLANHELPGMPLRYTSDGSDPAGQGGRPVAGPIADKGLIRVVARDASGRTGDESRVVNP